MERHSFWLGSSRWIQAGESVAQRAGIFSVIWIVSGWGLAGSHELFYPFFLPIVWIAAQRAWLRWRQDKAARFILWRDSSAAHPAAIFASPPEARLRREAHE